VAVLGTRDLWTMDDETYDAFRNHLFERDKFRIDYRLLSEVEFLVGKLIRPDGCKPGLTARDVAVAAIRAMNNYAADNGSPGHLGQP